MVTQEAEQIMNFALNSGYRKSTALITRNYKDHPVRLMQDMDGEVWFVAKDVCEAIGLKNVTKAIRSIPEDEKGLKIFHTLGGEQSLNVISESGRYRLTMRSTKIEAKPFQDWVVKEVLPSIRRTGSYAMQPSETSQLVGAVKDLVVLVRDMLADRIKPALPVAEISPRLKISQLIRSFVSRQKNGYGYKEAFDQLYFEFKYRYNIDLPLRAKNAKSTSIMDYAEEHGHVNTLYALALRLFPERYD